MKRSPLERTTALKRAADLVGGQRNLANGIARLLRRKTRQQTISYWIQKEIPIDGEYCLAIETLTQRAVTRKELRPDLFCVEDEGAVA